MSGNGGFIGAFGQFTLTAVDGLHGFMRQQKARAEDYESEAQAILIACPDAMEIVVLDDSGNYFDFVMREVVG